MGLEISLFRSGPLGGDQQVGAKICEGEMDFVIFFWDPLEPQPHDVDVKALQRIAVVYNIPIACNRSTADFLISSPLMAEEYQRQLVDFDAKLRPPAVAGTSPSGTYGRCLLQKKWPRGRPPRAAPRPGLF